MPSTIDVERDQPNQLLVGLALLVIFTAVYATAADAWEIFTGRAASTPQEWMRVLAMGCGIGFTMASNLASQYNRDRLAKLSLWIAVPSLILYFIVR